MKSGLRKSLLACVLAGSWSPVAPLCAQMPPAIAVSGEAIVATFHGPPMRQISIDWPRLPLKGRRPA